jgi:iron complex outermembrane recepter protein
MTNSLSKRSLLLTTAIAAMVPAAPALAQSADSGAGIGEIIVTARRVEERLQDVPISITVFSQQQLDNRNIAVASDLAAVTPSLSVNQTFGPEKASYSLRGFNQDAATAPTVGVYFAEVVGPRAQGGTTSGNTIGAGAFTDLENVQVLKGPQGTLFGRNTTGGAILLTPKKPTDRLEGYIEGTYGNYDAMRIQGALNLPLAETFRMRLTVDRNKRDGFMHNVTGIGPDDYNDLNYLYGRLSIVADLTPDLENYTIFHYSQSETNGYARRIIGCANPNSPFDPLNTVPFSPGNPNANPPVGAYSGTRLLFSLQCADQLARQNARGDSLYDTELTNPNPFLDLEQWQAINTTTWRASDTLTIKNIMSYGEFRERANFDLYSSSPTIPNYNGTGGFSLGLIDPRIPLLVPAGTPYKLIVLDVQDGQNNSAQSTFTDELQLQFQSLDGRFNGVLGGYLEFARPLGFSAGRTGTFLDCVRPADPSTCSNPLRIGNIAQSTNKYKFDNHGVFAQGTFKVTEDLAITLGGRWTFDKIVGYDQSVRLEIAPNFGGIASLRCRDAFRFPATDAGGRGRRVTSPEECGLTLTNKSNKPTWLANVDYKVTPDIMVYAKYARGYRQGGVNFTNAGLETWEPESLDSFEAGLKTSFRGAVSGYLNLAGFYNKLSNQQIFAGLIADPTSGVTGGNPIVNAGKSRSYGIEADASALFFDSLRFDVGYTYLNTKIQELDTRGISLEGTPYIAITPRSQEGQPFNLAPEHKLTVTGTYTLPLDESVGRLSVGATWIYSSSYFLDQLAPAELNGFGVGRTPASNLVNINVNWNKVAGSPVDLAFFATNVFEETFPVAHGSGWPSFGIGDVMLNPPRMYGVRLRYSFGE